MSDTSTAGNSRQRLRQLIDDLLSRARRASCETESLGRLVGETYCLDARKARSAAAYLKELGLVGDAVRLPKDVGHLRRHAREVFQRSISPRTEPHDLEQAQRDLELLNSEASRLVVFLRELESFCVNENASATPTAKPGEGQAAGGTAAGGPAGLVRKKRSTEKGEAQEKIIAAFTAHHDYKKEGCLNWNPVGVRTLAGKDKAEVSRDSVTRFFKKHFGDHAKYRTACSSDSGREKLLLVLKTINGDFSTAPLFGRTPPGEGPDEDDV